MVPALAAGEPPDDEAFRYAVDHPVCRDPTVRRQRAAAARLAARRAAGKVVNAVLARGLVREQVTDT